MINFKKFNSVISLTSYFTSDEKCKQAIIESRWGVGKQQIRSFLLVTANRYIVS